MWLACISIDLDPLRCYAAIHGINGAALDDRAARLVPEVATARFCDLLGAAGLRATFFVVGQEVEERLSAREAIARAALLRHEIASHSWAHDYRMSEWSLNAIALDLARARQALAAAAAKPVGFRAPGYNVSPHLLAALVEAGYTYDSSVLPSPAYFLARTAVIAAYKALGQPSASIVGRPEAGLAPSRPYRVHPRRPFSAAGKDAPLVELPIAVVPFLRVPFFGTLVSMLPEAALDAAWRAARRQDFLNLELHGLDVLDVSDGIPGAIAARQRDARQPATEKVRRLSRLIERIADDYEVVTLAEAAARVA